MLKSPLHFYYAGAVIVLAMLIGGGVRQSIWTDDILQILLIPAVWMGLGNLGATRVSVAGKGLAIAVIALCFLQFVPVPRAVEIPPALGEGGGVSLWSLTPGDSLEAALFAISLLGFWLYLSRFTDEGQMQLYRAFVVGLIVNLAVSAIQFSYSERFELEGMLAYTIRAGMFTNENHLATLTFMSIPLIAWRYMEKVRQPLIAIGIILLLIAFLFAIRSRAGMAAGPLVAVLSLVWFSGWKDRPYLKLAVAPVLLGVALFLLMRFGGDNTVPEDARWQIFANTWRAALDHLPWGAGMGSFVLIYPAYEPVEQLTSRYVNRAHNEYLEFFLETGVLGLALMLLGLWVLFTGFARTPFAQAAMISILAVAVHSIVEFPLRTMAITVPLAWLFAVATSVVSDGVRQKVWVKDDRPAVPLAEARRRRVERQDPV